MTAERTQSHSEAHSEARSEGAGEERTLGQLVADATRDLSEILRAEVALAKAELAADAKNAGLAGGLFAVAGYLGLLASIMACIAGGYGLVAAGLSAWAAFLILAGGLIFLALVLVLIGRSRVKRVGPPQRAIDAARATVAAVAPGGGHAEDGAGRDGAGRDRTARDRTARDGGGHGAGTRQGSASGRGATDR